MRNHFIWRQEKAAKRVNCAYHNIFVIETQDYGKPGRAFESTHTIQVFSLCLESGSS